MGTVSCEPPQYQLELKIDMEGAGNPWRNGKYKSCDGGQDLITVDGEKITFNSFSEAKLKFGSFGEADPKIVEMTGEKIYNVEISHNYIGKKMSDYGVLTEDGTKLVIKGGSGIRTRLWITDEEAEMIENDGDPIEAPTNHYKVEPERQGRLIWISGPPGLGKSTSAHLLSREHGFVYYEADCFFGLRNPYIPPNIKENPSIATRLQRKLVGEGAEERKKMSRAMQGDWFAMMKGEEWNRETMEEGMRQMYRDIARERARLGGDWAIAGVILTSRMRKIARTELGEDLEIIMLEMSVEEQEERVRGRHEGNQNAVDLMKVIFDLVEPAEENEENTREIKVSPEMTPQDVVARILGEDHY